MRPILSAAACLLALFSSLLSVSSSAYAADCGKSPGVVLSKAHREAITSCDQCHKVADKKCELTQEKCLSCHPKITEQVSSSLGLHGAAGFRERPCADCHTTHKGARVPFAHTVFPLQGRHASSGVGPGCRQCHRSSVLGPDGQPVELAVFSPPPRDCASCHRQDAQAVRGEDHLKVAGTRCESCHNVFEPGWRGHSLASRPFAGAHNRVRDCATCHSGRPNLRGLGTTCIACHQRHDIHHNSLGPDCGSCHTQESWLSARFNHDTVGCTLRGVHRVLPCADCHKGGNYAGISPMCVSCHRDDALRAAGAGTFPELHIAQTACTPCHNTVAFRGPALRRSPPESVCQ